MAYTVEQIENSLSYRLLGKRAKRRSNKFLKKARNKKIRQDNSGNPIYNKKRDGWEF